MTGLIEASVRIGAADVGAGMHGLLHPVLRRHAIARRGGAHGPELMHITLRDGTEVLPVFTSETAAGDFLVSGDLSEGWYARECCGGEFVSLLLGLYAGIDGVLIDPVYGNPVDGYVPENFMHWKSFVGHLLGDGQGAPVRPVPHGATLAGDP